MRVVLHPLEELPWTLQATNRFVVLEIVVIFPVEIVQLVGSTQLFLQVVNRTSERLRGCPQGNYAREVHRLNESAEHIEN